MERSGDGVLVDRLATINNNIVLRDADPAPLESWLDRNGLTAKEAARIQPMYGFGDSSGAVAVLIAVFSFVFLPLELLSLRVAAMMRPDSDRQWMAAMSYLTLINVMACGVVAFFAIRLFAPFLP